MRTSLRPNASIQEKLVHQFYSWEMRGRGWTVYPSPSAPEPPFRPFYGHFVEPEEGVDDGRKPTFLSSFFDKLAGKSSLPPIILDAEEEPEPELLIRDSLIELQTSAPANLNISKEAFEQFLLNLSLCREPVAFELLGQPERVAVQFVSHADDTPLIYRQLQAHFPEAVFQSKAGTLQQAWDLCEGDEALVVEFGLAHEFMLPLTSGKLDPFVGIVGALSELQENELGLFQVLFQPARHPWAESILRSVTDSEGSPFFVNKPELVSAAKAKVTRPLFAAVVRIAVKSESFERTLQIVRDLAGSLRVFAHPQGNELMPLDNADYRVEDHIEDVVRRQSRRSGMLLNSDELIGFVHLPSSTVRSPVLRRETGKTKTAPVMVRGAHGVLLGNNVHAEASIPVRLTPEQRVQHMHIVGVQGTGKSTLLFNLIRQDIENGEGLAVLDPHGDLIEQILGIIPPERINDVILVDPSDEQYSIGFNILSAHSDLEKSLLASDLISVFQRLSTSWGDQMGSVLQNAILAFLESSQGGTLADLRRFLLEPSFRENFLKTVSDPDIVYYWRKGFTQLSGNKSIGPVITRLNDFLSPKPIRYMVSQPANRLDFGQIIDTGKIFLAKLPQGQMGKENSFLLGSLFVAKIQQLVMARQAQRVSARKNFWLYIDEFHNFITPSMAEILTGARKYRLGLILAHQELRQLERDREVASAVLSSPYTRVVFRVGDADARVLENGFSFFEACDIQNLEKGHAICRVEKPDSDFNLTVPFPDGFDLDTAEAVRRAVITASRAKYATLRKDVETALQAKLNAEDVKMEQAVPKPPLAVEAKGAEAKDVGVQKPTVSQKEAVAEVTPVEIKRVPAIALDVVSQSAKESATSIIREPELPRDLGRGGAQHQAIQKRIKRVAEMLGFRSTIEKEVLEGKGSVDVLLERADQTIACEISITTTVDHEVGNVLKCLRSGHSKVAVVCVNDDRLEKIKAGVSASLGRDAATQVGYYQPDHFITYLEALTPPLPPGPKAPKIRRGFKVKHSIPNLSTEEQKQREEGAIRSIAEAMQSNLPPNKRKR